MRKIKIVLFLAVILGACTEDELSDSIIKDSDLMPNATDVWISEHFTNDYNIEVLYRWVDGESDFSKNLVPPVIDSVVPYLEVVKDLWIDTYVQEAGADFMKLLAPKQIMLVGSMNFNSDGTITEGTAEGGRKIILYGVNVFDRREKDKVVHMIHVLHHEFAHIMHQTKDYGVEFKQVTPSGYTATWYNTKEADARRAGFITPYAMMNTNEDFVEMVSTLLTLSAEEWTAILDGIDNPEGVKALQKKEALVADYFMEKWGISLYDFRDVIVAEIDRIVSGNLSNDE